MVEIDVIDQLDEDDKRKIAYFVDILIRQSKYRHLRDEIKKRRQEVKKGAVLRHDELWKQLDV